MEEHYDKTIVVFLHEERVYGELDSLGAYASKVRYTVNGQEYEELIDNADFTIIEEFVIVHVEEE